MSSLNCIIYLLTTLLFIAAVRLTDRITMAHTVQIQLDRTVVNLLYGLSICDSSSSSSKIV